MATEILAEQRISDGYIKLTRLRVRLADGAEVDREVASHGDAACVLPYDPDRRVAMLVQAPRLPPLHVLGHDPHLLEAPAGMLDGLEPDDCARKEAREETGLVLGELEPVALAWTSPGVSTERMSLYLAAYGVADRKGGGGGADGEHENLVVREMALSELWAATHGDAAVDMKTLALVQALRLKRPELFD